MIKQDNLKLKSTFCRIFHNGGITSYNFMVVVYTYSTTNHGIILWISIWFDKVYHGPSKSRVRTYLTRLNVLYCNVVSFWTECLICLSLAVVLWLWTNSLWFGHVSKVVIKETLALLRDILVLKLTMEFCKDDAELLGHLLMPSIGLTCIRKSHQ